MRFSSTIPTLTGTPTQSKQNHAESFRSRRILPILLATLFATGIIGLTGCGGGGGGGADGDGGAAGSGDSSGGGTAVVERPTSEDIAVKIKAAGGDMVAVFESEPNALAAYIGQDADKLTELNEQLKKTHVARSNSGKNAKTGTTDETVEAGGNEDAEFQLGDLVPMNYDECPDLETLVKDNKWIDKPVLDMLAIARKREAESPKPELSVAEALKLENDTPETNEKIKAAMGRLPPADGAGVDFDAMWSRHTSGDIKSTNPLMISSTAEFDVAGLTNFGLFGFDASFVPYAAHDAVVSWQTSENGMYDKVVMRDDLLWSDGTPITAHDIEFSYKAIMTSKVPVPAVRGGTDQLRGVKAYDDHTLVYFHPSALATNVWNINFPVIPKHVFENTIAEDPTLAASDAHVKLDEKPVVGGAYVIKKRKRGQEILLERRESYYKVDGKQVRDKPYFKNVRFAIIEDPNTALLSMKKGDIEEMEITPVMWEESTSSKDFTGKNTKAYAVEWTYFYFGWNNRSPFFRDARVRRAMGLAYNHAELMKRHRKGMDEQAACVYHSTSPWAPDEMPALLEQDLDKAEELLAEAGWEDTDGDGILDGDVFLDPEFDGQLDGMKHVPFEFTLVCSNRPDRVQMCELMRENLDQIGIVCNVRPVEFTTFQQMSRNHKFHGQFGGWGTGTDPDTSENLWTTKAIDAGRNYCAYSNPEVDKLFDEGKYELDLEKRKAIYQKIALKLHEDQPYTWLYFRNSYYAFSKELRGYNFSPRGPYTYSPGQGSIFKSPTMQ